MAVNSSVIVTAINDYIDQLSYPKINNELVLMSKIGQLVEVIDGIKFGQTVHLSKSQLVFQPGDNVGLINPQGTYTLTDATLSVCKLKIEESINEYALENKYLGMSMPKGSTYESMTPEIFASSYVEDKINKIQDGLGFIIMQGSTTGVTFSYAGLPTEPNNYAAMIPLCDGFLQYLTQTPGVTSSVIRYSGTASGLLTTANAQAVIFQMIKDMTANAQNAIGQPDVALLMSLQNYRTYINSLIFTANGAGNFNYIAEEQLPNGDWSFIFPGTQVRLIGMSELVGSAYMILTPLSNLVIGQDSNDDKSKFDIWYEKLYDMNFFRCRLKIGVTVKYPEYVTIYTGK
jgi:hypothetical protein